MEKLFNGLALSLEADTFQDFKADFQSVLDDTIGKMLKNGEPEGALSIKLRTNLRDRVNELGVPYKEPYITHEVTGAVQQKQTARGALCGEYSLEYSETMQGYVLRPADVAQTRLDDYL